jgi:hypothetical protein
MINNSNVVLNFDDIARIKKDLLVVFSSNEDDWHQASITIREKNVSIVFESRVKDFIVEVNVSPLVFQNGKCYYSFAVHSKGISETRIEPPGPVEPGLGTTIFEALDDYHSEFESRIEETEIALKKAKAQLTELSNLLHASREMCATEQLEYSTPQDHEV